MRKFVSITITTMLVFVVGFAHGQGYTFRVLANKGQNKVKKEGSTAAVALKTGATLSDGDELIASQGAYIGLMHKSGKTLEVRTPGTKKVVDLAKMVNTKSASVSSRYAKFLANKMNEKEQPNYRARLNATGAVSRGAEGTIEILIPEDATILNDKAIINWIQPDDVAENAYVVTVKNIFDEEIMKTEVEGTSIELNLGEGEMKNDEGLWIISIATKENKEISGDVALKRPENPSQYEEGLNTLKAEVSEDSPLNKIIYASFYEENGLIVDALTAVEEAISMNPDIDDFQILKKDIIERNGIKVYKEEE